MVFNKNLSMTVSRVGLWWKQVERKETMDQESTKNIPDGVKTLEDDIEEMPTINSLEATV